MGKRGRLSAGRVLLFREAWAEAKEAKWDLVTVTVFLVGIAAVLNLPFIPAWERGFTTGVLLTFLVFGVIWRIWVASGLSDRLHGVWAEDATAEHLGKARTVWGYVASYKYGNYDVDHVAVTPAGIYGIETKFRRRKVTPELVSYDAYQAAKGARSLRNEVSQQRVPKDLFGAVLVIWGAQSRGIERHVVETGLGDVLVLPGRDFDSWLAELAAGPIGEDFAEDLLKSLDAKARIRDAGSVDAGRVMRLFARAK